MTPKEKAQRARDNGRITTFLEAYCELLMCTDPSPLPLAKDTKLKEIADDLARRMGFTDWVEAYHGLVE